MKIAIGADHGGYQLKGAVVTLLEEMGYEVVDQGCFSEDSVDYPDYAEKVVASMQKGEAVLGVLVCGTGTGMAIAANRHMSIRAANCHDQFTAKMSREHNDANVLCLGARVLGEGHALEIVKTWINAEFEGGRHQRRIDKFSAR